MTETGRRLLELVKAGFYVARSPTVLQGDAVVATLDRLDHSQGIRIVEHRVAIFIDFDSCSWVIVLAHEAFYPGTGQSIG